MSNGLILKAEYTRVEKNNIVIFLTLLHRKYQASEYKNYGVCYCWCVSM